MKESTIYMNKKSKTLNNKLLTTIGLEHNIMNESDFKIEPHPLVRAGGQHVTTTSSSIQVTHIPTQLTVI